MDISLLLAKILGLYLMLTSIFYLYRRQTLRVIFDDFYSSPSLVTITGGINLMLGLAIVLVHNIWEWNYKLLITLIGYISLFKGLIHIYAPEFGKKSTLIVSMNHSWLYTAAVTFFLGAYLAYKGFFS